MHALSTSEKRTIRYATIGISIYLALFGGFKVWNFFAHRRAGYLQMVAEARQLKIETILDADHAVVVKKLMVEFQLDPAKLSTNSVVAAASAAIQKAAMSGGVTPGPIRESPENASGKELATIDFEGSGTVAAVISLVHRLPLLGYPLLIDSLQIAGDPARPDQIKLSVKIIVLNFEYWKKTEAPHA
ncbi:MAG: hypothetical protein ACLQSR_15920 [Limisphaerales bacterium]